MRSPLKDVSDKQTSMVNFEPKFSSTLLSDEDKQRKKTTTNRDRTVASKQRDSDEEFYSAGKFKNKLCSARFLIFQSILGDESVETRTETEDGNALSSTMRSPLKDVSNKQSSMVTFVNFEPKFSSTLFTDDESDEHKQRKKENSRKFKNKVLNSKIDFFCIS
jgi:hypothetical protein